MSIDKTKIAESICYTELVYGRINKKLNEKFSKLEIEEMLLAIIHQSPEDLFERIGKNIYVTNRTENIKITINSNTYRIITVDKITK